MADPANQPQETVLLKTDEDLIKVARRLFEEMIAIAPARQTCDNVVAQSATRRTLFFNAWMMGACTVLQKAQEGRIFPINKSDGP